MHPIKPLEFFNKCQHCKMAEDKNVLSSFLKEFLLREGSFKRLPQCCWGVLLAGSSESVFGVFVKIAIGLDRIDLFQIGCEFVICAYRDMEYRLSLFRVKKTNHQVKGKLYEP